MASRKLFVQEVEKDEEGDEVGPDVCGFVVETVEHGFPRILGGEERTVAGPNEAVELEELRNLLPC